jgi:TetR/AcrR family transcriptional repressor of nem operon
MAGVRQFDENAVLDRITNAFWTGGFEGTSIQDLERATGLGRQSLYNGFGTKESMFLKAMDRYASEVGAPIRAALAIEPPVEALRQFLDLHVARMADPACPDGCLIASSCHELGGRQDALGLRVAQDTRAAETALMQCFEEWRQKGALRQSAEPRRMARFIVALVRGLAGVHRATGDIGAVRDAAELGFEALRPAFADQAEESSR